jgi:hypothetical protein
MEAIKSSPVGRIYGQKTNAIVQRINRDHCTETVTSEPDAAVTGWSG